MYLIWNRLRYLLSPQFDIYEQVSKLVRGKVADIGFGTGFGSHLLMLNAKEVHAFEIDENAIKFAKAVFPFKKLFFKQEDITGKIIEKNFDYVIMIDVLEHIKNQQLALRNVKKMLSDKGVFICSTPNRLSRYRKSENHVREFATKELEGILKRYFVSVSLRNYRLEPLVSQYENPILAICMKEGR